MHASRKIVGLALLVGTLCATCSGPLHAAPTFTPLGDLPGGTVFSHAWGVSADGSVVVGGSRSESGFEAFRWTSAGGMVGLGDLPGEPVEAFARDVSADGSIIVGTGNGTFAQPGNGNEAFRWTSGEGMAGLGDLPGGVFYSFGRGISADGSIIVGESSSASGVEAFRWTSSEGLVGLGDLPGGGFESGSEGISADGSVIVGYGTSASGYEAFRWTASGGMVGLGGLPRGDFESFGFGVSADGSVVFGQNISASRTEAFRWTATGGMVGLGDLPGGPVESDPYDISADGSVIVGLGNTELGKEAFLWTADSGMQNLRELLVAEGATGLGGWTLTQASALSADGRTIAGFGRNPRGQTEAWIAVIGEPAPVLPDYDDSGLVEQADLDLVLLNWGSELLDPAAVGWVNDLPSGPVDQSELDKVLLNWGASAALGAASVPEPASWTLVAIGLLAATLGRHVVTRSRFMKTRNALLAALSLVICSRAGHAAATFTPLGALPGERTFGSAANRISSDGSVVVGESGSPSGIQAFRWTEATGMVGLGDLPGGIFQSQALDASADGSVIVGVGNQDEVSFSTHDAFRWTEATGMVGLGDLPGGTVFGVAKAISDDGSIIVGESRSASGLEAFRWTAESGMVGLGDLPGGPLNAIPTTSAPTVPSSSEVPRRRRALRRSFGPRAAGCKISASCSLPRALLD